MSKKRVYIEYSLAAVLVIGSIIHMGYVIYRSKGHNTMESWLGVVILYLVITKIVKRWKKIFIGQKETTENINVTTETTICEDIEK